MEFLNSGIFTIIAACVLFAGIKALIDGLGTKAGAERKRLIVLFSALFAVNLLILWIVSR